MGAEIDATRHQLFEYPTVSRAADRPELRQFLMSFICTYIYKSRALREKFGIWTLACTITNVAPGRKTAQYSCSEQRLIMLGPYVW